MRRGLAYAGRPLSLLPFPLRLGPGEAAAVAAAVSAVWEAAERVTEAFLRNPALRRVFRYGPQQEEAILRDPGYRPAVPLGRMDLFLVRGRPRILEFNTDGAAGWHYAAALEALWREAAGSPPDPFPLPARLLETLLRAFEARGGRGLLPHRAALVDWAEVGTRREQEALAAFFSEKGLPTTVEDPRSLRFAGGRLLGSQGPIGLVYRRLVSEEAFGRPEACGALLEAYREGAVCLVGSFRSDPAWSKTFLAVLSDPGLHPLWGGPPPPAAAAAVPWTRIAEEGETLYQGRREDLRRLLLENRPAFLLKPARSLEGRGVVAGPRVAAGRWRRAVEEALRRPGAFVVQEFIRPEALPFPDGIPRVPQPGAFVLEGRLAGFWGRAGATEILGPGRREWYLPVVVEKG